MLGERSLGGGYQTKDTEYHPAGSREAGKETRVVYKVRKACSLCKISGFSMGVSEKLHAGNQASVY